MKRRIVHLWPLFVFPLFTIQQMACNKTGVILPASVKSEDQKFFMEAKASFFSRYYAQSLVPKDSDTIFHPIRHVNKFPAWENGYVARFSFGRGVVVPVTILDTLSISVSGILQPVNENQLTWLFMYKDPYGRWHVEVITRIPAVTQQTNKDFNGEIRIEDWTGQFLQGYLYSPQNTLFLATSSIYRQAPAVQKPGQQANSQTPPEQVIPFLEAPVGTVTQTCTTTDWYACTTIGSGPTECTYAYSTQECSSTTGGKLVTSSSSGAPTAADYQQVGGGAGGPGTYLTTTVASITPDTSITSHPIVECVYAHLMSATLQYGLKNILSSFDDNEKYNITFMVADSMNVAGMTSYKGNNTFVVKLNADDADDPDYSRIYLACTFIHEAFHAKLRQKALEVFGETPISQWPTPIDNMNLAQLATYFEAESKSLNIWESIEHDWMVENIDQMGMALKDFVQTYYKSTYATVGSSLTPYDAMMYMGLEGSPFYQEDVVATGLEPSFTEYRRLLNEGGKCQD